MKHLSMLVFVEKRRKRRGIGRLGGAAAVQGRKRRLPTWGRRREAALLFLRIGLGLFFFYSMDWAC
jgi:hypothetical protein